ncbi:MAG: YihY/virulence factor BrkB family protein [Candidatus Pacebacteria bacterium]|mgnify:CR=1 FL=1|nr:YihY/virulence factor BrkB family protein [Candidatus Paceibacterota bacterium]
MKSIVAETFRHWKAHHAPRMGAALSYYSALACVPLLILVVSASSLLFSKDVVEITLMHQLIATIGAEPSRYISELLHNTPLQNISTTAAIVSAVTLILATMGIFSELRLDLNELWHTAPGDPNHTLPVFRKITTFVREKILILSLVPILALLLIVSILITVLLSLVQSKTGTLGVFGGFVTLFQIIVPVALSTAVFTLIYRIIPRRTLRWRELIRGGFATAVLFIGGNILIAEYIQLLVHSDIFGTASSLIGLLVWMYYSAQVFLLGASYTFVHTMRTAVETTSISSRD